MGERVFILNERLNSWWIGFTNGALDENKYDGTVRTPRIFTEIDRLVEQFAYTMNPGIANAFTGYRLEIYEIESLYRKLCLAYGGNTTGNIIDYSSDLLNEKSPSFADIKATFLNLLEELDYTPTRRNWWDPPQLQEAALSGTDMVVVRQKDADFIRANMPSIGQN